MNQIHVMRIFLRVAETQSFRHAAQQLNVSNALVTRSIASLEAHLKTRLINRTTRKVSLTEAGMRYVDGCRTLLEELDHLEGSLAGIGREPSGTLRVVVTSALSPQSLTQLLDSYRRRYPKVRIRLTVTERVPRLVEDGYDVGLLVADPSTPGETADTDVKELSFASQRLVLCAAPFYLTTHHEPHHPDHLALHACLATPADQRGSALWHFVDTEGNEESVAIEPSYMVDSPLLVRLAAIAGMGVAILPESLVADDFAIGNLRRVMSTYKIDDWQPNVSLVYPRRQHLPAKTRTFIEHALERAGAIAPLVSGDAQAVVPRETHARRDAA
ncbi:LysR substrate-binding domain-containing protein [Paraburkholderia sp. EG287A]|uniref:LysR family transcriptional regulator n=1 Tax=unclassified Paraburkholderia TaxID=2615204 RepID=UPI0034D21F4A